MKQQNAEIKLNQITYETIYERYNNLVWYVARKIQRDYAAYHISDHDVEDMVGHVWQKIMTIKLDRLDSRGEAGYVRMVINNGMRDALTRIKRNSQTQSFHVPLQSQNPDNSVEEPSFQEPADHSQPAEEQVVNQDLLVKYLELLSQEEKTIAVLYLGLYGNPQLSVNEISRRIKRKQKYIQATLDQTFERMRDLLTS